MTVRPAYDHLLSEPTTVAEQSTRPAGTWIKPSLEDLRSDRLGYLADLINELQTLARESQCHVLAGILGLAYAEARQQIFHSRP